MLPTGGGKSVIFSQITKGAFDKEFRVWIIVPRDELLRQSTTHLLRHSVPHGVINAASSESPDHLIHLVSKNTLERRYDKIINWPKLIIIDEGHLNYKFQIELKNRIPESTYIIAMSATPERMSGESLSDIYTDIIYGSSIKSLISQEYLTKIKYFSPPLEGIEKLHKKGSDVDAKELKDLFKEKFVYGKAIDHYKQLSPGKSCMVFCRSVEASKETADQFNSRGYNFKSIDGKMNYKQRKIILGELETGAIQGVCSCEILVYGIDIPRIEVIIMLRPTFSRTYFMQMIGRGLRPYEGKEYCLILDHVNNVLKHGHPLDKYTWNFYGKEGKKSGSGAVLQVSVCPKCSGVWPGLPKTCPDCGYNLQEDRDRAEGRKPPKEIEGILREVMPGDTAPEVIQEMTQQALSLQSMTPGKRQKAMMSNLYRYGNSDRSRGLAAAVGYKKEWVNFMSRRLRKCR